jgi:hypothetical protein
LSLLFFLLLLLKISVEIKLLVFNHEPFLIKILFTKFALLLDRFTSPINFVKDNLHVVWLTFSKQFHSLKSRFFRHFRFFLWLKSFFDSFIFRFNLCLWVFVWVKPIFDSLDHNAMVFIDCTIWKVDFIPIWFKNKPIIQVVDTIQVVMNSFLPLLSQT